MQQIFEQLYQNIRFLLLGQEDVPVSPEDAFYTQQMQYLQSMEARATQIIACELMGTLQHTPVQIAQRGYLFESCPMQLRDKTGSSQITLSFDKLKTLALAYALQGSCYYHKQALLVFLTTALDFICTECYAPQKEQYGNWYDWEIGTPLRLVDVIGLLYPELTQAQIACYTDAIYFFCPKTGGTDPKNVGANLLWKSSIVLMNAIYRQDIAGVTSAAADIETVLATVQVQDGFHADGSFIQHQNKAYNGGYGKAVLITLSNMIYALKGTPYAFANMSLIAERIQVSYLPFLVNNSMMDLVRNREVSRSGGQDLVMGKQVIRAILLLADCMPEAQKQQLQDYLKACLQMENEILQDVAKAFLEYYLTLAHVTLARRLMTDALIVPAPPLQGFYPYLTMAKFVQRTLRYTAGISCCNETAVAYEVVNTEGQCLWHLSDGMLFIYGDDIGKYANHYWGTADKHRLPGTTVLRQENAPNFRAGESNHSDVLGHNEIENVCAQVAFGIDNGAYSQKSYFLFEGEIALLTSGISSVDTAHPVETTVEQCLAEGAEIHLNGKQLGEELFALSDIPVETLHYQQCKNGQDQMGYWFPPQTVLQMKKEQRTQSWLCMNEYEKFRDEAQYQNTFFTAYADHGCAPSGDSFAAVLLPQASKERLASYQARPAIAILENSSACHAIYQKNAATYAYAFWQRMPYTSGMIKVDNPCCILIHETEEYYQVSVAPLVYQDVPLVQIELALCCKGVLYARNEVDAKYSKTQVQLHSRTARYQVKLIK